MTEQRTRMIAIVTIDQWPRPIRVPSGETILAAALAAGLPYPHGCRSGNCGACKSRLIAGRVELAPHSDYALTAAEWAGGLILACRATPITDCTIALPAPAAAPMPSAPRRRESR